MIPRLLAICSIVWSVAVYADVIDDTVHEYIADTIRKPMRQTGFKENAVQGLTRGLTAAPVVVQSKATVRYVKKKVERTAFEMIYDTTGVKKEHMTAVFVLGVGASRGEVGTKGIKYRIRPAKNLSVRPDLLYNFRRRQISSTVDLTWEF